MAAGVAAEVLARYGIDFAAARRAGGRTNLTWLAGDLAVRVARRPDVGDLEREARLVAALPAEVGHPRLVAAGATDGLQWTVTERVAAANLDEVWPTLDAAGRVRATRQLWQRAEAVHRVDVSPLRACVRRRSPFYPGPDDVRAALRRLGAAGVLGPADVVALLAITDRHRAALRDAVSVLNHGDLSPVNALWDGHDVVSLLDFEFAVLAPVQVDLNEMVKHAFAPGDTDDTDDDDAARRGIRAVVAGFARPHLRETAEVDLLIGYAVQLETWEATRQMAKPGRGPVTGLPCVRMLRAFADTGGGYYAPLLSAR